MWCTAKSNKVEDGCKAPLDVLVAMYDVLVLKSMDIILGWVCKYVLLSPDSMIREHCFGSLNKMAKAPEKGEICKSLLVAGCRAWITACMHAPDYCGRQNAARAQRTSALSAR